MRGKKLILSVKPLSLANVLWKFLDKIILPLRSKNAMKFQLTCAMPLDYINILLHLHRSTSLGYSFVQLSIFLPHVSLHNFSWSLISAIVLRIVGNSYDILRKLVQFLTRRNHSTTYFFNSSFEYIITTLCLLSLAITPNFTWVLSTFFLLKFPGAS